MVDFAGCWFNASMQALFSTAESRDSVLEFAKDVFHDQWPHGTALLAESLQRLFFAITHSNTSVRVYMFSTV